jgi:hypothetical protein
MAGSSLEHRILELDVRFGPEKARWSGMCSEVVDIIQSPE